MLVLSRRDIYEALDWNEVIDVMGGAFKAVSSGRALVPVRTGLPLPEQEALLLLMPGSIQGDPLVNGLAVKTVGLFYRNPARNLPLIYGLVTLFNPETGQPLAILDGATVTAVRTGGASGLATRHLARKETPILALFGAGAQAETQLKAVCAVRAVREVRICSRDQQRAERFREKMSLETGLDLRVVPDPARALRGAGLVVTATSSRVPVFADENIEPGTHINGIGSYTPEMQEIPGATVKRARLVVDSVESCLSEAGDILIPLREGLINRAHIQAELGEIVAGEKPGREAGKEEGLTFFKSVGNAAQDVALAVYLYRKALALGCGTEAAL